MLPGVLLTNAMDNQSQQSKNRIEFQKVLKEYAAVDDSALEYQETHKVDDSQTYYLENEFIYGTNNVVNLQDVVKGNLKNITDSQQFRMIFDTYWLWQPQLDYEMKEQKVQMFTFQ